MITSADEEFDLLAIKLDTSEPIKVLDLAAFLSGVETLRVASPLLWPRPGSRPFLRPPEEPRSLLTIAKIETGSLWIELAAIIATAWTLIPLMDAGLIVREYYKIITGTIYSFSREDETHHEILAGSVKDILKPVFDKSDAAMRVSHVKVSATKRKVEAEMSFDKQQIDVASRRATLISRPRSRARNGDIRIELPETVASETKSTFEPNVAMQLSIVNSGPGKRKGRPVGDMGTALSISPEALPVHFRSPELKSRMVQGQPNPHTTAFWVDVFVDREDGKPKNYMILQVHGPVSPPSDLLTGSA